MPSRSFSPVPSVPTPDPKTKAKPLSQFSRLSQVVRLYTPDPSIKPDPTHPTTILLCSWNNAAPKHIEYYTRTYTKLYPSARIIVSTMNTKQFLFTSESTRRAQVRTVITALLSEPQMSLMVHALSNGGAKRLYAISASYAAATGKPLPLRVYVLDSAPGIPQFKRDIHALNYPVRGWNWWVRWPFQTVVVLVSCVVYVVVNWLPRWFWYELVWGPHDGAHNTAYLNKNCVKAFVYSKEDEAIDWRNVEAHAKETEERGFRVERKLIEGAAHVQLFKGRGGELDYWGFIQKVWDMGREVEVVE
ncbi:hypothetical protein GLAREA_01559 [Glarea lozoyensis ATCC 20868]|uniref:Indole-diterpene biosynthesis protein PaxU n=1 Tax=Glarea lozoyensis (strain ATCC 20868 / MF5171) TaxID=1116229 RepID=S3CGL3_GLAL2|nr:uncharacterized protein GLAREA_01559 [Glarea lozoyensis ATCC 20868]EPE25647.1 hypothetical protein GLAREA_01559 [Glarea lozoyensis ATCC 20868]